MFVQLFFNLVIYEYSFFQSNFYKKSSCFTFLFKTNKVNKWTTSHKAYVFVVSCSAAGKHTKLRAHAHTSHATRKRAQCTCPKHGSVHRLNKKTLPAHGGLASFSSENPVVVLHRHQPPNQKARAACAENTLTGVVPLASAPAAMTTIMQMMTKVVTQRSAVLQSI